MIISKMDNKGRGITYHNNKIVFVNNALVDEDVEINLILDKSKYSVANVSNYNKLSEKRVNSKCPYYRICGGCQLQHMSYEEQIKYKISYLNDIFQPFHIPISKIIASKQFNYRDKITLKFNNGIGFYKINSNDLINIEKCDIADKVINDKIKYLKSLNLNNGDEVIIKSFNNKSMLVINSKKNIDLHQIMPHFDTIYLNNKLISGNRIIATIGDIKYFVAPNAFFQVNMEITVKMFNYIKSICQKYNAKNVLDLYCGCGSISLFIADIVNTVYGIELNQSSTRDAQDNKKLNSINNVNFRCDTTDNINIKNQIDTLIVDPPRSGLSKKVKDKIISSKVKNIIYVSCDPITLKRDLLNLKEKYQIQSIYAFDMFPNTYHVECVSLLIRK